MHMSVGAFTKGLGFANFGSDIVALLAFVPVFLAIAACFLRKQQR
jgi:ribosome-dependent ATPase